MLHQEKSQNQPTKSTFSSTAMMLQQSQTSSEGMSDSESKKQLSSKESKNKQTYSFFKLQPTIQIQLVKGVICWDLDDSIFANAATVKAIKKLLKDPGKSVEVKDSDICQFLNSQCIIALLKKATELGYVNICVTSRHFKQEVHDFSSLINRVTTARGVIHILRCLAGNNEYFSRIVYTNGCPKTEFMQHIVKKFSLEKKQVILVDDNEFQLNEAMDEGFSVVAVNEGTEDHFAELEYTLNQLQAQKRVRASSISDAIDSTMPADSEATDDMNDSAEYSKPSAVARLK